MKGNSRVDWTRLDLTRVRFGVGVHDAPSDGPTGDRDMCIMEAVAFIAGEGWTDYPRCACPVISAFLRYWNDSLSNAERDRLLPAAVWVPRLVGSRSVRSVRIRRAYIAFDWTVRTYLPLYLDLISDLREQAALLRDLPEIVDLRSSEEALWAVREVKDKIWPFAEAARAGLCNAAGGLTKGPALVLEEVGYLDLQKIAAASYQAARSAALSMAVVIEPVKSVIPTASAIEMTTVWLVCQTAEAARRAHPGDPDAPRAAVVAVLQPALSQFPQTTLALLDRMFAVTGESGHAVGEEPGHAL